MPISKHFVEVGPGSLLATSVGSVEHATSSGDMAAAASGKEVLLERPVRLIRRLE